MTRVFYGGDPTKSAPAAPPVNPNVSSGLGGARIVNTSEDLGIELSLIKTLLCSRVPVMDGPTRLYDEFHFECLAVLNPQATAYKLATGERAPLAQLGERAPKVDDAIRHYLLNPNRRFRITVGGDVLLDSPPAGRRCDAANGPIPTRCDILDIWGNQTFLIRWGCKTWINPCERVTSNDASVVLSHRWNQERAIDQDGMSTLITRGHAIFDIGKMYSLPNNVLPDNYWNDLARPLETGFRRDSVQVVAAEDGTEIEYCIVDRETPVSLIRAGVSRVEATYHAGISRISAVDAAAEAAKALLTRSGRQSRKLKLASAIISLIPEVSHEIVVRAWGYRYTPKKQLEYFAREMIGKLLSGIRKDALDTFDLFRWLGSYNNDIRYDLLGRFVEVTASFTLPPIYSAITSFESGLGIAENLWPYMPLGDQSTEPPNARAVENVDGILETAPKFGPPLPNGTTRGGSLGTWVGRIAAQYITRACQRQPHHFYDIPVGTGRGATPPAADAGGV